MANSIETTQISPETVERLSRQFAEVFETFDAGQDIFSPEAFFDLNDTDWGADSGFAQNRFFAGLAWKFDPEWHTTVEVGYLNQFLRDRSDDDSMNHILSMNLFLDF